MIGEDLIILIIGAMSVYLMVLAAHSLRYRFGLAPFYVAIGTITALMSWITDAGIRTQVAGITFLVGSTVFYTALLLGVFVVYVFDGPQPTRVAIFTIAFASALVPLIAVVIHYQVKITGDSSAILIPLPSLRINAASVFTTMADLVFLAVAWEFLGKPNLKLKIWLRAFLTLLGVMWLDVFLFSTAAFAGSPEYFSIMEGTLLSRLIICIFASSFLYQYIQWQNVKMGVSIINRPVLAILHEVEEVRAELGLAHEEIELRKKAEKALKENEERYSTFINSSNDMAFLKDQSFRYLFVNRAYAEFWGKSAADMINLDDRQIMPSEIANSLRLNDELTISSSSILTEDLQIGERTFEARRFAVKLGDNEFGVGGYLRDVTDARKAQKELDAAYLRLNQIMEFLPDPAVVIDDKRRVTFWNRAMTDLTGVRSSEILGKGDYEHALPFYGERRPLLMDLALDWDDSYVARYISVKKQDDGVLVSESYHPGLKGGIFLSGTARALYDADGKIAGAIESLRNITEIKNAERAIKESERLYSQIIEFLPDATMVIDSNGKLISWNQAMESLTGVKASEIIGKDNYEYALPFYGQRRPVMLDLVIKFDEKIASGYHGLRHEGDRLVSETYLEDFCGRGPIWLWNIAAPLYDQNDTIIGAIEAIRDITEIKVSERIQLQTERYKAVVDLAAGVAHNFNNFLQIIIGNANVSLTRLKSGNLTNLERNLNVIMDTCFKGAETVKRLNKFASYTEFDTDDAPLESFDVSETVEEAAELTKPFWHSSPGKKGVTIRLETKTHPGCLVKGKKSQIMEILVNLIKNAVEAMPAGGLITIRTYFDSEWVVLKVKDTGQGIPKERLGNLFNPFFTSNLGLGRGLGLATALKITQDHRGDISVESVEGQGSTFTVRLPSFQPASGSLLITEDAE